MIEVGSGFIGIEEACSGTKVEPRIILLGPGGSVYAPAGPADIFSLMTVNTTNSKGKGKTPDPDVLGPQFNATDIRSITFTYGSSSMFADPTYQHIGIYNIDYTVVPEPGALEICSIIGVIAVWTSRSRKRQNHDADTSMTESPVSNETS